VPEASQDKDQDNYRDDEDASSFQLGSGASFSLSRGG
jgi:hypothetical protein